MVWKLRLLLILQLLYLLILPLKAEDSSLATGELLIGIFSFKPMNFIDEKGEAQGLYPDLLKEIASKENWSISFVEGSWAQGLERLENEEIDLMISVAYSEERDKIMDFNIESVIELWGQIFCRPEDDSMNINDLQGQKVGVMAMDINGQNFINTAAALGIQCEIVVYDTYGESFQAVREGHITACVSSQHFGLRNANTYDLIPSSIQFSPFSIYFAAKEGKQTHFLRIIDTYLIRWKEDRNSTYYRTFSYWMTGETQREFIIPSWLISLFLILIVVAAASLLFIFLLRSQINRKTEELLKKERQYRSLVENANSIILRINKKGLIFFANKYGLDFFGYEKGDLLWHDPMGKIFSEKNDIYNWINETQICFVDELQLKEDKSVFIQWNNTVLYDHNGLMEEILCIGVNISDRLQVEKNLQESNKQLEEMVYIASHDLQVPLVSMEGYASELLENYRGKLDDEATYCLTRLQKNSRRMHKLVLSLLDISRLNTVQNYYSDFSMNEVLLKIENDLLLIIEEVDGRVFYSDMPSLHADRLRIEGVFRNLIINAFNYGSSSVRVSYSMGIFQITDDGIGIPESQHERIFNPGERLKMNEADGVGMGLTFCRKVVEKHNGTIHVKSDGKGKGCSFFIEFPYNIFVKEEV